MTKKEQQQVEAQRRQQLDLGSYSLLMSGEELAALFAERDELRTKLAGKRYWTGEE